MKSTIIVIPAEGDSADTEQWYIKALVEHYRSRSKDAEVLVFEPCDFYRDPSLITQQIRAFFREHNIYHAEIHAQGGLGASVACRMINLYSRATIIDQVFFIGGAPSEAMTFIAKFFHRYISRLWYLSRIPFFADDPNPYDNPIIQRIRASSTATMRRNPRLYRDQLVHIGTWKLPKDWRPPKHCKAYFVPNGKTVRPEWWDNTYNNSRAQKIWAEHGVKSTPTPSGNFSFYSLMPFAELLKVLDAVRKF